MRRIEKGEMNIQILFLFKLAEVLQIPTTYLIELPETE
jgi:transcriptional regulator with XRE-family HTH domain